jgi:hypothetical protein
MSGAWRLPEAADAQSTFFSHALALAALHGPGPWPDGEYPLPDEDPAREQLMVGSVLDGIRTHHFGSDPDAEAAARIADLVADLVTGPRRCGRARNCTRPWPVSRPCSWPMAWASRCAAGTFPLPGCARRAAG